MDKSDTTLSLSAQNRIHQRCEQFIDAWKQCLNDGDAGQKPPNLEEHLGQADGDEGRALFRELLDSDLYYRRQSGGNPTRAAYARRFSQFSDIVTAAFYIGRYEVIDLLGSGAFGNVFRVHDPELRRDVAAKVPHSHLIKGPKDVEAFLEEGRALASLKHEHIVPVYDCGRTDAGDCYVVSMLVEGSSLKERIELAKEKPGRGTASHEETAKLMITLAEALQYAHSQGLVHRDIKPANILIDKSGKAYLADFGLAMRDIDVSNADMLIGTPTYMSPEQARGEGNRLDHRSDIFSLGVVFYELLAGRRPFSSITSAAELLKCIREKDAPPPSVFDASIPKALERICLKCLSRPVNDRHTHAGQLADELRYFLEAPPVPVAPREREDKKEDAVPERVAPIVPKGLRSFDEHDAGFFLRLLPGPYREDGLPESLYFWKTRIEETDADKAFRVGVIYGPSGCGKSSLVRAGLIPHLDDSVIPILIEATPDDTEKRLLAELKKHAAFLNPKSSLRAALHRKTDIPSDRKLLLVLDQFEQWLHGRDERDFKELAEALRECDGARLQCLLMIRDDFWTPLTEFMYRIGARIRDGDNAALVNRFSQRHAKDVLVLFGQAYDALPASGTLNSEEEAFVQQVIDGLAENGRVICVRLALFSQMVRRWEWKPATLKRLGGTEGVGVVFLDESLATKEAPASIRAHQREAEAVLRALLPEQGTDIKGARRSRSELMEQSGYGHRPDKFSALMEILDTNLRLITPTESAEQADDGTGTEPVEKYYQLTHDYLVPSLREWLSRKQKETRRGRAELRLAERSALWNAKPENRHLPAWWEYCNIGLLTSRQNWTDPQRRMMAKGGRIHGIRWGSALLVALVLVVTIQQMVSFVTHRNLTAQVQTTVASLNTSRGIILPPLNDLDEFPREMVLAELRAIRDCRRT